MTTQYRGYRQTEEDIFTDVVGRLNGLNEADWLTAFDRWQENEDPNNPEEPVWTRVRTSSTDLPVIDISAQLEPGGWIFMVGYRGEPDPAATEPGDADENDQRPMVGRAVINIPTPPRWEARR